MNSLTLQTRAIQATAFSPRLQHAVRLLQMSAADYAQALHDEAEGNPFLELADTDTDGGAIASIDGPRDTESDADADASDERADWASAEHFADEPGSGTRHLSHDESFDLLQQVALPVSLRAHLHAQVGVLRLSPRECALAQAVIEAIDEDGYLRVSLEEIADAIGERGAEPLAELRTALCRVQALDPLGVGARSVAECLMLQSPVIADPAVRSLAQRILEAHIDLLATRNLQRLATALREPLESTRAAVEAIRRLNARPGWQHGEPGSRAITPDITVRKVRGTWTARLNSAAVPRVHLNRRYAALLQKSRVGAAAHPEMNQCLEKAKWTVQNVAQRMSTILDVGQAIVERQALFLEYGALAMKPLGLREIADAVGVHPSTVSRASHGKYMDTPWGVYEFRHFFSRGLDHSTGSASAPAALKELIRELITAESREMPLSDAELTRQLGQQGFRIARRTVTKYRQGLGIDSVERRRGA
ncbi:MAG: RNA polymerase sigma-54 factor [Comamonadaceae bacterium]|nr:MAG: RNA polymerase sigma-54 factor [Comamonadaceae bacterium]